MDREAVFEFRCGTKRQAGEVAAWLECEDWPDDLRAMLQDAFGDLDDLASIVFAVDARGSRVLVQATDQSSLEMTVTALDYAMQNWSSVPSPQGFTFAVARPIQFDLETGEIVDRGEYDGGAVLLRRGAEPEYFSASEWLKAKLRSSRRR